MVPTRVMSQCQRSQLSRSNRAEAMTRPDNDGGGKFENNDNTKNNEDRGKDERREFQCANPRDIEIATCAGILGCTITCAEFNGNLRNYITQMMAHF